MPVISRFLGIAIYMYWNDHNPPHFHAVWNDYEILIEIETARVIRGDMPPNKLKNIINWCNINKAKLLENWGLARNGEPLQKIEGLDE